MIRIRRPRISRRSILVLTIAVFGFIAVFGLIWSRSRPLNDKKVKKLYTQQLTSLQQAVDGISPFLEIDDDNKSPNLERYDAQINKIYVPCAFMTSHVEPYSALPIAQKTKDNMIKAGHLCEDLVNIGKYTQTLYKSCESFMVLDESAWPDIHSSGFTDRLTATTNSIASASQSVKKINYPVVSDPAQNEFVVQLDKLLGQTKAISQSIGDQDYATAQTKTDELQQNIAKTKYNFLTARTYFWNTTIQYHYLSKAITDLHSSFANK